MPMRTRVISVVIAVVAIAGASVAVVASSSHGSDAPRSAAAASTGKPPSPVITDDTPTPSATPTVPSAASYNFGITQGDIAGLMAEDQITFVNRPAKDRALVALYYAQSLPAFAKDWQSVDQWPGNTLPAQISADNTPEEILAVVWMSYRQVLTLHATDGGPLEVAAARKVIGAELINSSLSVTYKPLMDMVQSFADFGGGASSARTLAVSGYLEVPKINTSSAKYTDAAGMTCVDMNITETPHSASGPDKSTTYDTTACLVANAKGAMWERR